MLHKLRVEIVAGVVVVVGVVEVARQWRHFHRFPPIEQQQA